MEDVFIVDAITPRPGQARTVLDRYMADYAPLARERGMVLRHSLISPPLKHQGDRMNTLSFIWAVAGTEGWWKMRLAGAFDPRVRAFWKGIEPLVAHRERTFHEEAGRHV